MILNWHDKCNQDFGTSNKEDLTICGIVGYTGTKRALPFLLDGLEKLEYRGYDSAGIAVLGADGPSVVKSVGATMELRARIANRTLAGTTGLGHTRWATHGIPSERNAHPHTAGPLLIVHNGIVENSRILREELESQGEVFASDTDTETIVHLVNRAMAPGGLSLAEAVRSVLHRLEGSYSFLILHSDPAHPLVAVHRGAPLVIGRVLRISPAEQARAERLYAWYGVWSLLFSWLPVVGDPLCLAGGILRVRFGQFLLLVATGKLARYVMVALVTLQVLAR